MVNQQVIYFPSIFTYSYRLLCTSVIREESHISHLQPDLLHCGEVSALPVDTVRLQEVPLLDLGDALGDEVGDGGVGIGVGLELPEGGSEDGLVADDALLEEIVHGGAPQEEPDQLLADVRLA